MSKVASSYSFGIPLIIFGLFPFISACPKTAPAPTPVLDLADLPKNTTIGPDASATFQSRATTNVSGALSYVYEKLSGEQTTDVTQLPTLNLGNQNTSQCKPRVDAYRLVATAGNMRKEKAFSVTYSCSRSGIRTNESQKIKVEPSEVLWLTPGSQVTLNARSQDASQTIRWARIVDGEMPQSIADQSTLNFQAPLLDSPCQIKDVFLAAISTSPTGEESSKTVSIHVQNSRCVITTQNGLSHNSAREILVASDDSVYIGTKDGLSRFRNGHIEVLKSPRADAPIFIVTSLAEVKSSKPGFPSTILIGKARRVPTLPMTIGFGVERLSQRNRIDFWENTTLVPNKYVSDFSINQTSGEPVSSMLFAGHYQDIKGGGILTAPDLSFSASSKLLDGENLYASLQLPNETLLGGDGGLFVLEGHSLVERFDGRQWSGKGGFLGIGSNRSVRALALDDLGNVWIGLEHGWLYQPGGLIQYTLIDRNSFQRGTWSAVVKLPLGNDVRAFAVDEANRLWIATDKSLTLRQTDGTFKTFGTDDGLPSADIHDVVYDPETKNLWIATAEGVARWGMVQPF